MKLSVVIPTCARSELLKRTVASLAECSLPPEYDGLLVIENGKRSGTEQVVRDCAPRLRAEYRFVSTPNKSLALNDALPDLDGLLLFADDDIRFSTDWLVAYAEAARRYPERTFFGGPFDVDCDEAPPPWLRPYLPHSALGWNPDWEDMARIDTPAFIGFNWAAYAADLRAIGGFSPRYGPGSTTGSTGQETEAQRRLLQHHIEARYVAGARVWHYVPAQRCSADWVVQRSFRRGVRFGLDRGTRLEAAARLIPAACAAAVCTGLAQSTGWCSGQRHLLPFRIRRYAALRRGYVQGLWHCIKTELHEPAAMAPPAVVKSESATCTHAT